MSDTVVIENPSPELVAIWTRVGNGMTWLTEHDPDGAFHIWWKSGLTTRSPMPGQANNPEYVAAWRDYFEQRRIWEELWKRMVRMEDHEIAQQRQEKT